MNKNIVKKALPKFVFFMMRHVIRYIRLGRSYFYDFNHYYKYSMSVENSDKKKLVSQIVMDTHVIEKGLTMPDTRHGFGIPRLIKLIDNVRLHLKLYGLTDCQVSHAVSVINEYFQVHQAIDYEFDTSLLECYHSLSNLVKESNIGDSKNAKEIDKEVLFSKINASFLEFSSSRSSLRSYSDEVVDHQTLIEVLDHCRNTPSACNRQSVRIHLYENKEQIEQILKVQGGNRGFGHLAKFVIAITFEPSKYFEQQERNLGYVDGGMYAMNILYTLHANNIAACVLNASHSPEKDKAMRAVSQVPNSETFVAFISGGYASKTVKVAQSYRYPLDIVATVH